MRKFERALGFINCYWIVYLLVRQLPYTAKAQKSYDGYKIFPPTRLVQTNKVQRSLQALITIHGYGEPHEFITIKIFRAFLRSKRVEEKFQKV